jgi:hypothetical protein
MPVPSAARRLLLLLAVVVAGAVVLLASSCGSSDETPEPPPTRPLSSLGPLEPAPPPGRLGGELVPIPVGPALAPAASRATHDEDVNGIRCEQNPRLVFHVHAHVKVFVEGAARRIPAGVGVWPPIGPQNYRGNQFGQTAENCLAWLSTRYADGLIHVESSELRGFVLGDFFDVWGQPLGANEVGPAKGPVTAIVDGEVWTGDPREIPLESHTQIQLAVGKPLLEPQPIEFPGAF